MRYDLAEIDAATANRLMTALVVPRPIAWVVTQDRLGHRNAAPFSFFNILCSWPAVLAIGMQPRSDGSAKDSRANIEATGEFVVNLVPFAAAAAMNLTADAVATDVDELALAGLATLPSIHVAPPRIAAGPVAFECRLRQIVPLDHGRGIVLGDVLCVHVADAALIDAERGHVDAARLDLIARMHGRDNYLRATDLFTLERPSLPDQ